MDLNRNQCFLIGLVVLYLGLQFRVVDSLVLTPEFTSFLAERTGHPVAAASNTMETLLGQEASVPPKTVRLPEWIGWALISLGTVFILHSMAMKKPA
jgi:uncharacterized membrane protein YczE